MLSKVIVFSPSIYFLEVSEPVFSAVYMYVLVEFLHHVEYYGVAMLISLLFQ